MIFNGKENKEAGAICFEIRIPRKKNKELLRKVPSKLFYYGKNKNVFGLSIIQNTLNSLINE